MNVSLKGKSVSRWLGIGLVSLCLLVSQLTACTPRIAFGNCAYRIKTAECPDESKDLRKDADITRANNEAADKLVMNLREPNRQKLRLVMTTIADIDNFNNSSSLGRLIGEQLSARFAQHGLSVLEAQARHTFIVNPRTGGLVLSHDLQTIGQSQFATAAVAGTYAVGEDTVYVTLKIIRLRDGELLSSHVYTLPIGANTEALLQKWWWW